MLVVGIVVVAVVVIVVVVAAAVAAVVVVVAIVIIIVSVNTSLHPSFLHFLAQLPTSKSLRPPYFTLLTANQRKATKTCL